MKIVKIEQKKRIVKMFAQQDVSIRIDWLSFTVPRPEHLNESEYLDFVIDTVQDVVGIDKYQEFFGVRVAWKTQKHHKPYSVAFRNTLLDGLVLMYSMKRQEMLIELQGSFCERYPTWAKQIAHAFAGDVTRLDVACDVRTDVRPMDTGFSVKSKTWSVASSASGETIYTGSSKSEKMMRVYRYNPPHPRADLLRSEVVFRRGWAKKLASALHHPTALAQYVVDYWRKQDASWWLSEVAPIILGGQFVDIVSPPLRRGSDKSTHATLTWLHKQVRPAIARANSEGASLDEILDALGLYWSDVDTISIK